MYQPRRNFFASRGARDTKGCKQFEKDDHHDHELCADASGYRLPGSAIASNDLYGRDQSES